MIIVDILEIFLRSCDAAQAGDWTGYGPFGPFHIGPNITPSLDTGVNHQLWANITKSRQNDDTNSQLDYRLQDSFYFES